MNLDVNDKFIKEIHNAQFLISLPYYDKYASNDDIDDDLLKSAILEHFQEEFPESEFRITENASWGVIDGFPFQQDIHNNLAYKYIEEKIEDFYASSSFEELLSKSML